MEFPLNANAKNTEHQAQGPCTITFVVMPCPSTDGRFAEDITEPNLLYLRNSGYAWWISSGIMTAILFVFNFNCSPLSISSNPYRLFMGRDITKSHVQLPAVWPHALGILGILAMFLTFFYCHRSEEEQKMAIACPCFCPEIMENLSMQVAVFMLIVLSARNNMCISVYLAKFGVSTHSLIAYVVAKKHLP